MFSRSFLQDKTKQTEAKFDLLNNYQATYSIDTHLAATNGTNILSNHLLLASVISKWSGKKY